MFTSLSALSSLCLPSTTVFADHFAVSSDKVEVERAAQVGLGINGANFGRRGASLEWHNLLESPLVTPSPSYLSRKGDLLNGLWIDGARPNHTFDEYLVFLRSLEDDGLPAHEYGLNILKEVAEADVGEKWELAQLCTRSLIKLLSDLHWGRKNYRLRDLPQFTGKIVDDAGGSYGVMGATFISDDNRKVLEYHLDQALDAPELIQYLREQLPNHPQYLKLKHQLAIFRELAASDSFKELQAQLQAQLSVNPRAQVTTEQPDLYIRVLKEQGDILPDHYRTVMQDIDGFSGQSQNHPLFIKALKRFQLRMGLAVDGVMGSNTLKELARPAAERAQTIVMNLERWRWLPHAADDSFWNTFIMVNTAGFELVFVRDRKLVDRMPVIVGTRYNRTPTFSAIVEAIELNPYWNVPTSIANHELWPKERRSPGSLGLQNIRVLAGGRLRQDPGPSNALGRIKFVLPNPFSVYLHDTPTKQLFNHDVRAFSHGCIRVSRPLDLAREILNSESPQWTAEEITNLINQGSNRRLNLENHIPIHIIYRTAWVEADGAVHFRQDIYGKDLR